VTRLAFLLLILPALQTKGQKLVVSAISEMTVYGYQGGGILSFQNKHYWRFGAFYQAPIRVRKNERGPKNEFLGLVTAIPLAKTDKIIFYGVGRGGVIDKTFMVFTPGLDTEVKIGDNISLCAGMSIRNTYPSVLLKINFML
jgi:hypothetical protein